jgi:hypothetical protein
MNNLDLELEEGVVYAEEIADVKLMESLRDEFHVDFDKVPCENKLII